MTASARPVYEAEYRCFCRLADSVKGKWCDRNLYFEPFSDELKLAEIIVGDRATVTRAELAEGLGDQNNNVTSFKSRPAFKTSSVVRNRDDRLWK